METVIVLPLFLVLLGGIQWIGQLIYDKQRMVVVDRYVAWNMGNHWRAQDEWKGNAQAAGLKLTGEAQDFFPNKQLDEIKVFTPNTVSINGWVWQSSAGMQITAHMPDWTRGLLTMKLGTNFSVVETNVALTGRNVKNAVGTYIGHVVYMKSGNSNERTNPVSANQNDLGKLELKNIYKF
jgi:ribosomal protein S17E